MDKLVLADIQALASSGDYGGGRLLLPASAALAFSAASFLSDLSMWQGAGYQLTIAEIDDIEAMVAQLENDLIVDNAVANDDFVRVTNNYDHLILPSDPTILTFNTEIYDPNNMHTGSGGGAYITVKNDGLYVISFSMVWSAGVAGMRQINMYHVYNGGAASRYVFVTVKNKYTLTGNVFQAETQQIEAVVGDFFFVQVFHNNAIPINVLSLGYAPFWSIARV